MLRLLTWNLAKRVAYQPQVEFIASREPTVVALQEVSYRRANALRDALAKVGLPHSLYSRTPHTNHRTKTGVLLATRLPLQRLAGPRVPLPESVLAATLPWNDTTVTILTAHVPNTSGYGDAKVHTIEAMLAWLEQRDRTHAIVCGDFNTPQREHADGSVVTFGQRINKRSVAFTDGSGRKDRAERTLLLGIDGMRDAFRNVHGYGVQASSWRRFRLDHMLVGIALRVEFARYLNAAREAGGGRAAPLSDHAALEVHAAVPANAGPLGSGDPTSA